MDAGQVGLEMFTAMRRAWSVAHAVLSLLLPQLK
jgi:hypothetical protein